MNTICVLRLALCLVINSIKLQFFCTPFPSHKRTIHYLKIEILVPNARSNFDVPHINSNLSRILNVINLLHFLQRCRSPSPILTSAPHCSLHRCIIHTLIALYPNRLSLLRHLTSCASPVNYMHPDELALYLGEALLFWWQHAMNSIATRRTVCIAWWWMQLALLDPRISMDTLTASDLR